LNQSYDNLEVIAIDDGSTDTSNKLLLSYLEKDSRIRIFTQSNHGCSSARNKGIEFATGDYLCFVDSDDFIESNYLMQFNKSASDIIVCGYSTFGDSHYTDMPCNVETYAGTQHICKFVDNYIGHCYARTPWAKAYKSTLFTVHGLRFNPQLRLAEDLEFNLRAFYCGNTLSTINAAGYCYLDNMKILQKYKMSALEYRQIAQLTMDALKQISEICPVHSASSYILGHLYTAFLESLYARKFVDSFYQVLRYIGYGLYAYLPYESVWRRAKAVVGLLSLPIQKMIK